jgi:hypothetical protein
MPAGQGKISMITEMSSPAGQRISIIAAAITATIMAAMIRTCRGLLSI